MSNYSEVDAIIDKWASIVGTPIFREWPPGTPARYIHVPGDPPFECFQISVLPPNGGKIKLYARSIDTNDDDEFEAQWEGQIDDLDQMLAAAVDEIATWKRRIRKKPDPPSPW